MAAIGAAGRAGKRAQESGGGGVGGLLSGLGGALGGPLGMLQLGGSLLGGMFGSNANEETRNNIMGLAGSDVQNASTGGGQFVFGDNGGALAESAQQQQLRAMLGGQAGNFLQGGMFNDPQFQAAFGNNDIQGAFNQAQGGLQQMMGNSFNQGNFNQTGNNIMGLGNQFAGLVGQGPQDQTGGLMGNLFAQGQANQAAAGDQSALFDRSLASQRAAAAPEFARQQLGLENSLFAKGMLGNNSTATGEGFRGLFEAQNQADLGFQNNAFNQATQQQNFLGNLGSQQIGQGGQFLGQNLGQFNQNAQNAQGFAGLGQGQEGQGFLQQLQALTQNQSAGNQRLQNSLGLFGLGNDTNAQNFGLGLQANQGIQGMNQFGLDGILGLLNADANRIGASGQHAQALGGLGQSQGGFLSGLVGGLFG